MEKTAEQLIEEIYRVDVEDKALSITKYETNEYYVNFGWMDKNTSRHSISVKNFSVSTALEEILTTLEKLK